jgi:hypothetical protein
MNTIHLSVCRFAGALALAGVLAMAAPGCGKAVEEITETAIESGMPGGGNVEIDQDGETFSIQSSTEDGGAIDLQAGDSVALPADFPSDIPVPDGVTWNLVQNAQIEGKASITAQGMLKTPLADVAAFVKKEAEGQGWTTEQSFQQAGQMEMLTFKKDERMLHATITDTGDGTALVLSSQ